MNQTASISRKHTSRKGCFLLFGKALFSIFFGAIGAGVLISAWLTVPQFSAASRSGSPFSFFCAPSTFPTAIQQQVTIEEDSAVIDTVKKAAPGVLSIVAKQVKTDTQGKPLYNLRKGIGTGFVIDKNGIILTNRHVVSDKAKITYIVVTNDNKEFEIKPDQIHEDYINDLALITIPSLSLANLELGDSTSLQLGQRVIAIGNALGEYQNTVTVGVISGIGRELEVGDGFFSPRESYEQIIQTDATINPGNSGGPLLNSRGQVIGINTAKSNEGESIGFAIPINSVKELLENFKANNGKIIRPYFGTSTTQITKEIALVNDLPTAEGAFVEKVAANSPAATAGIAEGDIIVKVNNLNVTIKNSLARLIITLHVGDTATITLLRGKEELTKEVVLTAPTEGAIE
ncbi:MAG: trypsin-like peptidase domain-containing protein [bacterium]